ncbi:MAG: hypothetical protein GY729_11775 [Desulfobacteraceae bacterium]|nr:hypothetical protein [Desulfobacteraceae bacterium]
MITEAQLKQALELQTKLNQDTHSQKLIGEVISELYNIPAPKIENLFMRKQIRDSLFNVFKKTLESDALLTRRLDKANTTFYDHVNSIESFVDEWVIVRAFHYSNDGEEIENKRHIEKVKAQIVFDIFLKGARQVTSKANFSYYFENRNMSTNLAEAVGTARLDLIKTIFGEVKKPVEPVKIDFSEIKDILKDI